MYSEVWPHPALEGEVECVEKSRAMQIMSLEASREIQIWSYVGARSRRRLVTEGGEIAIRDGIGSSIAGDNDAHSSVVSHHRQ